MSQELYNRIIICAASQVTTQEQQFRPQQKCEQTVGIGQGLACLNTKSAKSEDIVLVYFQQFL